MPRKRIRLPAAQRSLAWTAAALIALLRRDGHPRHPCERPDDHEAMEAHMALATLGEAAARDPVLHPLLVLLSDNALHHAFWQAFAIREDIEATLAATPFPTPFRRPTLTATAAALLGYEPPPAQPSSETCDAETQIARTLIDAATAMAADSPPSPISTASRAVRGITTALAALDQRATDVPAFAHVLRLLSQAAGGADAPMRDLLEVGRFLDGVHAGHHCPETGLPLSTSGRLAVMLGRPGPIVVISPSNSDPLAP